MPDLKKLLNQMTLKQKIDFKKITLLPHERKEISFEISEEQLRFWNFEQTYCSEAGEIQISTGCADHLLHTKSFELQ